MFQRSGEQTEKSLRNEDNPYLVLNHVPSACIQNSTDAALTINQFLILVFTRIYC